MTTRSDLSVRIFDSLRDRCTQLGFSLWQFDVAGNMLAAPAVPTPYDAQVQNLAMEVARATAPREIAPGNWLIGFEEFEAGHPSGAIVALIPANDIQTAKRFEAMLRGSHGDSYRMHTDARTIEQFAEKLAQAYEETSMVYSMARLFNNAADPCESLQTIVTQLQQVLPFKWLAIRFSPANRGVRELAGKTMLAGRTPCALAKIEAAADPLLDHESEVGWRRLLDPATDPIAQLVGAQVLAEPITHDGKVIGAVLAGNKVGPDQELNSFEMQFLDATADFLGVFHENLARFAEQEEMFLGTVRVLTASIDAKDSYTRGHSERVGLLASKMAAAIGLDQSTVERYRVAGLVHDVGKIGVPEAVLSKPGRLTEEEFAQIKLHPQIGHNILRGIASMAPALPGVLSHHERWDGNGYPNRIAGESIPLIARVLALADTFDAMSSNRSYRPAASREKVLAEIRKNAGSQFDPALIDAFVNLDFSEFDRALVSHEPANIITKAA